MPAEHIEKIRIPDSDMPGWLEKLRSFGLTEEEIDSFFFPLNETYLEEKKVKPLASSAIKEFEDRMKKIGKALTKDEREYFLKGIEYRIRKQFGNSEE